MENTPQIRNATKARIGPWYVLQTRNPAAPGMRFDTLLGFVRKGRVKPKSVVRGPTTHQLWRHAYQVKGLSREFGVCYSCGGTIDQTAKVCGRCNRLQEPPANPDALLENEDVATTTAPAQPVFKEIKTPAHDADIVIPPLRGAIKPSPSPATVSAAAAPIAPALIESPAAAPVSTNGSAHDPLADDHPSIASNVFALDEPHEPSGDAVAANDHGPMMVASDLAAAFRLNIGSAEGDSDAYASVNDGSGSPVRMPGILARDLPPMYIRRHNPKKIVATIFFLGALGVALWLIIDNSARDKAVTWFNESFNAIKRTADNPIKPHMKDGDDAPDATDDGAGVPPATTGDHLKRPGSAADAGLPEGPASTTNQLPFDPSINPLKPPTVGETPKVAPRAPQAKVTEPEFPKIEPEDASTQAAIVPPKAPETVAAKPAAPVTPAEPAASDGSDEESPALKAQRANAMQLFRQANEAMQAKNFINAGKIYEQIKQKFPKEAWPGGLELKLRLAKRSAGEP